MSRSRSATSPHPAARTSYKRPTHRPLPGGFQLANGFFYEIFTTASYTPPITICLPTGGLPSTPQILHYEGETGFNVPTTVVGDQACGRSTRCHLWRCGTTEIYNVSGPFQPVDAHPTPNTMKAGQTVPVKFSLGGDYGLDVFADGYPVSQDVTVRGRPTDPVEATSSANSGLRTTLPRTCTSTTGRPRAGGRGTAARSS